VVTGRDGKCYGLNICKLLRINVCYGVTAWRGDRQRRKGRRQNVETRHAREFGELSRAAQSSRACAPQPRFFSLIIAVVFGKADAV
jgi:serine/threonine-protein kinase RIO1